METLTEPQRRALQILTNHGAMTPAKFARYMWPDTATLRRSAGAYLAKLNQRGWVLLDLDTNKSSITSAGIAALDAVAALEAFDRYEAEKAAGTLRTVPHDEVRARLGLEDANEDPRDLGNPGCADD